LIVVVGAYQGVYQRSLLLDAMWVPRHWHASAQDNLGRMYANGWGVKQSHAEAAKWYRRSADQGHADGKYDLGYMLENGWGVEQSHAEALEWFGKAADQGNGRAQVNLGLMYENGRGVKQSHADAAKWFRKAADQCELCEALLTVFVLVFLQHDWVFRSACFGVGVSWLIPEIKLPIFGAWCNLVLSLLLASCCLMD
jgi:TPR repeat protein